MNQPIAATKNGWQIGYLTLLGIHLLAIFFNWDTLRFVTKPLLMVWLLVYFISITVPGAPFRKLVIAALFFSWLGDVFLMQPASSFFMAGLASFLLAQLLYTWIFLNARKSCNTAGRWNPVMLISILVYIILLYAWLFRTLPNELRLPVLLYAIAIGSMLATAFHVYAKPFENPALLLICGAALFVLSDSLLAINQFIQPYPLAGVGIMLTYGLAQLFIVKSISRIS